MICLDTSAVVDILRGKHEAGLVLEKIRGDVHAISTPSVMEAWKGAVRSRYPEKEKHKVLDLLDSLVALPLDMISSLRAGEIEANLEERGLMIDLEDIMTAAICIEHRIPLVTRNVEHFARIKGLEMMSY